MLDGTNASALDALSEIGLKTLLTSGKARLVESIVSAVQIREGRAQVSVAVLPGWQLLDGASCIVFHGSFLAHYGEAEIAGPAYPSEQDGRMPAHGMALLMRLLCAQR